VLMQADCLRQHSLTHAFLLSSPPLLLASCIAAGRSGVVESFSSRLFSAENEEQNSIT